MKPLLQVRNLTKSFGAVVAAADINVDIDKGEMVAVIGANGAGKTTFVNMVTGYLPPSGGSIVFSGQDLSGLPPRQISKVGICRSFQVAQLFTEMTVLENVMLSLEARRFSLATFLAPLHKPDTHERAMEVLREFRIDQYADARVDELAQGVRKLLDISMAMVGRPELLLLDEPTSGVAIEEKFDLMDTVMDGVRQSGAAVIFIEHDMDIVRRYADRVIAFYAGQIIADGPTEEALAKDDVRQFVVGEVLLINPEESSHA